MDKLVRARCRAQWGSKRWTKYNDQLNDLIIQCANYRTEAMQENLMNFWK